MSRTIPLVALLIAAISPPGRADNLENPYYKSWSSHKPGTSVTSRCTDVNDKLTKVTLERATLGNVTALSCAIYAERFSDSDALKRNRAQSGRPETVERDQDRTNFREEMEHAAAETITVAAGTFNAKMFERVETAGDGRLLKIRIWFCEDVPGLTVKTEVWRGKRVDDLTLISRVELVAIHEE